MAKRILDILFAVAFLLVFSPVFLIVPVIIKCTSPGPVIYKAKRIGKGKKMITVYKYRSMHVESGAVRVTTLANDERIYPFGKFLRKTKIDEFPQVVNILLGNMSIVGPRPEDFAVAQAYYTEDEDIIFTVKPGLTSPASLFDYTHGENYPDEELYIREFLPMKLDVERYYVTHQSFFYDVQIILRTAWIIIRIVFGKRDFDYPKEYTLQQKEKDKCNV